MAKKKTAPKTKSALAILDAPLVGHSDYPQLLADLKSRIKTSQVRAHLAVNRERTLLYWEIGQLIQSRQDAEGWGSGVIPRLAADLKREFPNIGGFSERNLKRMIAFYREYPGLVEIMPQPAAQLETPPDPGRNRPLAKPTDSSLLQQPVAKVPKAAALLQKVDYESIAGIPWFHNVVLIEKIKDLKTRLFYARSTLENGWSRPVLVHQIESELHLRAENRDNNFAATLPEPQSDLARELIKDSFNLEFLDIREKLQERDLEEGLITQIRDFLLELGTGFAFIGNQHRLEIGGQEYFLDLLFYHTRLHCHVVVELKIDAFKPEYAGKMQFYLAAVDDLLATDRDAPSIGILLCKEKNKVVVEYTLRDSSKPIAVADYTLQKTLPKALKGELPTVAELEKSLST